jgi:peptide/nickel transport system substrate-binding protein
LVRATITAFSLAIGAAQAIEYKPAVNKDTIVVWLEKSISNLDAQVTSTGDSLLYAWQVYDTLYGFDSVGNLIPRMASGVKISPDRLSYTFTLRRGITFHNGDALTPLDVKFSLERILDPAVKSTRRVYFAHIVKAIETSDKFGHHLPQANRRRISEQGCGLSVHCPEELRQPT